MHRHMEGIFLCPPADLIPIIDVVRALPDDLCDSVVARSLNVRRSHTGEQESDGAQFCFCQGAHHLVMPVPRSALEDQAKLLGFLEGVARKTFARCAELATTEGRA